MLLKAMTRSKGKPFAIAMVGREMKQRSKEARINRRKSNIAIAVLEKSPIQKLHNDFAF